MTSSTVANTARIQSGPTASGLATAGARPTETMRRGFAIAGPFPPPRHGVSAVNETLERLARESGVTVERFDTAPQSLDRALLVRLRRIGRVLRAALYAWRFSRSHRGAAVYISLSGGAGLLYEAGIAAAARLGGARVIVHHHSFRYIDAPYWGMRWLTSAAGRGALHIALGEKMGTLLRARYPRIQRLFILSNAGFVADGAARREGDGDRRPESGRQKGDSKMQVGYLSNLSVEKGMDDLLDTAERCMREQLAVKILVAGPFEDAATEKKFRRRAASISTVEYVGPLHGVAKDGFYRNLDVFIFPTRYRHEAEPLVVLEALQAGVPVIAFARGCIPDLLAEGAGVAVPLGGDFGATAVVQLQRWKGDEEAHSSRRRQARRRFEVLATASRAARGKLLDIFMTGAIKTERT